MRHVISVSLSEKTVLDLKEKTRVDPRFRNKSHLIEYAIQKVLEEDKAEE
ncbi:TPA: hypothetical protein HA265_02300 [Candidatus Woesearchaeota archaeon]|nr:hypothetical protein [Candidatus Woesearchaeota archaeon]